MAIWLELTGPLEGPQGAGCQGSYQCHVLCCRNIHHEVGSLIMIHIPVLLGVLIRGPVPGVQMRD